jgi:hypothetical protein
MMPSLAENSNARDKPRAGRGIQCTGSHRCDGTLSSAPVNIGQTRPEGALHE